MWERGRTVTASTAAASYDELLAGLAGWVLVGCVLWAALWVLAALVETVSDGRLPALGWVGAPTRLRPVLLAVVGLLLAGAPAHAAPRPAPPLPVPARPVAGAIAGTGTGTDTGATAGTKAGNEAGHEVGARASRPGDSRPAGRAVVVRRGDTLWGLAEERLPPGATAQVVADGVRAWHARNRAVIGPDPDLIRPGQRLLAPPAPDLPQRRHRIPSRTSEEKP